MCNVKRVELPFELNPYCICYHNLAFPFGVIQGNGKINEIDVDSWMLRKFTNCVFDDSKISNKYEICLCDVWGVIDGLTTHQNINFLKSTFDLFQIDILLFLKKAINAEFYITGLYNEKFIPNKKSYQKYDFWHDYIIYGYSDDEKCFYSAGFLKNGSYMKFEIPYECFLLSIEGGKNISFNFYQFNKHSSFKFNVIRVTKLLRDYLNSDTHEGHRINGVYGIQANKMLKGFFKQSIESYENGSIDLRYSRAFVEHKFFIRLAILSLHKKKYIELTNLQLDLIEKIYYNAKLIHALSLRINVSNDNKLINKIIMLFEEIEKIESNLLTVIVDKLEENLPDTV